MSIHKVKNRRTSLTTRLILAFIGTSIIPIILYNMFSYFNTASIVKENVQELTQANLNQAASSLDVWIESYEDILFQVYMNDDVIEMVEHINESPNDLTLVRGQLRRSLRGMFYTREYVKSIAIITPGQDMIFYDLLSGYMTKSSWLDNSSMSKQELYDFLSKDNKTHIISTRKAGVFNTDTYYLFHLGHRLINYKNVEDQIGVVIVSIDEKMLKEICGNAENLDTFNFMVNSEGLMMSYYNDRYLGEQVIEWSDDPEVRKERYMKFIQSQDIFDGEFFTVNAVYNEKFQCDIINVSNQNTVINRLQAQQRIMILVMTVSLVALVVINVFLIRTLTGSLLNLVGIMKRAGKGEMSARAQIHDSMPVEVETIASQFNKMLDRVEESISKERDANEKQREAEIAALEAQINPHFLYNTLDTINWMAIDRDEYEISNSITSLASILRYGINKSNAMVTVREECEWLRQYLFLQQTRLKNTFECEMHISPEILDWKIHKLLLQPFIENAIIHGFEGKKGTHRLEIEINAVQDTLQIGIRDNGKGIPEDMVEQMNRGIFPQSTEKRHIGMENAINRIHIYYEERSSVIIESKENEFTQVSIKVPHEEE